MLKIKGNNLRKIISLIIALSVVFTIFASNLVFSAEEPGEPETTNFLIVTDNEEVFQEIAEDLGEEQFEENETLAENNILIATDLSARQIRRLEREDGVLFVEEDIYITASDDENLEDVDDAFWEMMQYYHEREYVAPEDFEWNMQAVSANDTSEEQPKKDSRIRVAVMDSGIDIVRGVDLEGSVNLVPTRQDIPMMFIDSTGHGTQIGSIIAGNPQGHVQGVNPNTALYSVKVLDSNNRAPVSRIVEGIFWSIENEINIINMSFGTPTYSNAMRVAVESAYDAGILMIGAAGNDSGAVEYPAAFPQVMAVAATGTDAQVADFSNVGEEVEVAAPGERIMTTSFFGLQTVTHGTSIAVPHITGAASLLWKSDPAKSHNFIRQLIAHSARSIECSDDFGLLDVAFALEMYEEFAENWDGSAVDSDALSDNTEEPETFPAINDDENYVEGRWHTSDHLRLMCRQCNSGNLSNPPRCTHYGTYLSNTDMRILRLGSVFTDRIKAERVGNFSYARCGLFGRNRRVNQPIVIPHNRVTPAMRFKTPLSAAPLAPPISA